MNTKRCIVALLLTVTMQPLLAFDPVGPPPSSSLSATVSHITKMIRPRIDYADGKLGEVLEFITDIGIPEKYRISIDATMIRNQEKVRVKLVERDISILAAVAIVAEQIDARVVIEPGKIILIPSDKLLEETK